jgi:SAM-dependent methyltransferase
MELLWASSDFLAVNRPESRMPHPVRQFLAAGGGAEIAAAYNEVGFRYGKYADGGGRNLFTFEGRHAYSDRKTWEAIESRLLALRARGLDRIKVLDLGCGPGTWLRRVVIRARQIGFTGIDALGIDIADTQLYRARVLSRGLAMLDGVTIDFGHGDLRSKIATTDADLCLCLYGVLNHIPVPELPDVLACIAGATRGHFIATVRAAGSTPTVYVDEVSSALRFYQDNSINRLDVEFANGRRASFQSHLFSRAELTRLAGRAFEVEEVRGLDLFHNRFATDSRWNPPSISPLGRLTQELARLEERYCTDPGFIDHATHLLLMARNQKMVRP